MQQQEVQQSSNMKDFTSQFETVNLIQFAQSQIQIKPLVGQCFEQQNNSTLQTQQEFTAIKQYQAVEVLFSTSDNAPHHNPKSTQAQRFWYY